MTESSIWKELKHWAELNTILMDRIESPITKGLPDVYFTSSNGFTGWIELKIGKLKKTTGLIEIPYRDGQQGWLKKHKIFHDNVFVLVWLEGEYLLINECFDKQFRSLNSLSYWAIWRGKKFDSVLQEILNGRICF
jgi:hypothetical protein